MAKGSLVAQSKQAAQFLLIAKVLVTFACNKIGNLIRNRKCRNQCFIESTGYIAQFCHPIKKCITYFARQLHTIGIAPVA